MNLIEVNPNFKTDNLTKQLTKYDLVRILKIIKSKNGVNH